MAEAVSGVPDAHDVLARGLVGTFPWLEDRAHMECFRDAFVARDIDPLDVEAMVALAVEMSEDHEMDPL